MSNASFKNKIKGILPIFPLLAVLAVLILLGIYRCPLNFIFGIPCPFCGMTRALMALLKGNVKDAFFYHPLWPVFIVGLPVYILYYFNIIKLSKRQGNAVCYLLCVLVAGCYIIRHITHSPIVAIHFDDSLIGNIFSSVPDFKYPDFLRRINFYPARRSNEAYREVRRLRTTMQIGI